jgi:hypothetical protein
MIMDPLEHLLERIFHEKYNSFNIKFWRQDVKEGILTVNLIEVRNLSCKFIEHRECRASVREARHHRPYIGLENEYFVLEFFAFSPKVVTFLFYVYKLLSYNLQPLFSLC